MDSRSLLSVSLASTVLFVSYCVLFFVPLTSRHRGMSTKPTAPETITCSEGDLSKRSDLRVLHFNDVYHVEPSHADPVGGITRFQSMCNHYRHDPQFQDQPELLAFFSGDGFNPSLESSVTKGRDWNVVQAFGRLISTRKAAT